MFITGFELDVVHEFRVVRPVAGAMLSGDRPVALGAGRGLQLSPCASGAVVVACV
jgi:hypothetical protein